MGVIFDCTSSYYAQFLINTIPSHNEKMFKNPVVHIYTLDVYSRISTVYAIVFYITTINILTHRKLSIFNSKLSTFLWNLFLLMLSHSSKRLSFFSVSQSSQDILGSSVFFTIFAISSEYATNSIFKNILESKTTDYSTAIRLVWISSVKHCITLTASKKRLPAPALQDLCLTWLISFKWKCLYIWFFFLRWNLIDIWNIYK